MTSQILEDKTANKKFAMRLAQARTEAGFYSRQKFCIEAGFDFRTYNRWESGRNKPQLDSFFQICRVTGKDPFWFDQ